MQQKDRQGTTEKIVTPGGFWLQTMSAFMILDDELSQSAQVATIKWKQ